MVSQPAGKSNGNDRDQYARLTIHRWCAKNGQLCEYKERKKPGLRAGYGRELEARLGELLRLELL